MAGIWEIKERIVEQLKIFLLNRLDAKGVSLQSTTIVPAKQQLRVSEVPKMYKQPFNAIKA